MRKLLNKRFLYVKISDWIICTGIVLIFLYVVDNWSLNPFIPRTVKAIVGGYLGYLFIIYFTLLMDKLFNKDKTKHNDKQ